MAGRREKKRERMRSLLLDVALALFEARGYDGTTIDQIAETADVARQTVLNYFPQKHDFIEAWGARRRELTVDAGVAAETSSAGPVGWLHGVFARLAEVNERERALGRAIRQQMIVPQPVPEVFARAIARGRELQVFDLRLTDQAAAEVCAALYYDTMQRWLAEDPPRFDLGAELKDRLDLLLGGLVSR